MNNDFELNDTRTPLPHPYLRRRTWLLLKTKTYRNVAVSIVDKTIENIIVKKTKKWELDAIEKAKNIKYSPHLPRIGIDIPHGLVLAHLYFVY